jgi:hypothetical protein
MAGFKNGADLNGEWLAAFITLINANADLVLGVLFAFQCATTTLDPTMRASPSICPYKGFDESVCRLLVVEVFLALNSRKQVKLLIF